MAILRVGLEVGDPLGSGDGFVRGFEGGGGR